MPGSIFQPLTRSLTTRSSVACDLVRLVVVIFRSRRALAAESIFLRKQLALFQERKVNPRRAHPNVKTWLKRHPRFVLHFVPTSASWLNLVERWFGVLDDKAIRRGVFRSVEDLKAAIEAFLTVWNQDPQPFVWTATVESITEKLSRCRRTLERFSPAVPVRAPKKAKLTVQLFHGHYTSRDRSLRTPDPKQRWLTYVHYHAKVMGACDFFVVITAAFRTLCVFLVMEIGSRRILHYHVTAHPTAEWTVQQFREALPGDPPYRFLIHDRDRIFAAEVDQGLANLGVRVLRTPAPAPKANSVCERLGAFVANVSTC